MVTETPSFSSVTEALAMVRSGLEFVAAADATELPGEVQAQCLQDFEQDDAMLTAARAQVLGAFTATQGYLADGAYSPKMWLFHRTRVTKGCAAGHMGWARRAAAHPRVLAALVAAEVSVSWARSICDWSDRLPEACREEADGILLGAARKGLDLWDLTRLAGEMFEKSRPKDPGGDEPGRVFEDRSVRLATTFGGAGVLAGDLTPECAAIVSTVLDALSAPAGAEDTRSHEQRYHDALQEAMRRLVADGLVPDRAGQPTKVVAHIALADLLELDADSVLLDQWAERVRAQWAGARAALSVTPGDGGAWLEGEEARGFACDASVTPVVTGDVDPGALEDLVRLCVELAGHGPGHCAPTPGPGHCDPAEEETPGGGTTSPGGTAGHDGVSAGEDISGPQPPTGRGREALEKAIIGKAVDLLSGPGGLASFLRRGQLGARLGGPSLPLDVGFSENVPAGIRNAVRLRDQHCRFPGGCLQPASACEIHHVTHKSRGGKTSVNDCVLLCFFHHHVMIHRMGWTLVLNPDGTTTAWNPDKSKVLHSHGPPARAG
jgi:Domain of unknown function (DUF222)